MLGIAVAAKFSNTTFEHNVVNYRRGYSLTGFKMEDGGKQGWLDQPTQLDFWKSSVSVQIWVRERVSASKYLNMFECFCDPRPFLFSAVPLHECCSCSAGAVLQGCVQTIQEKSQSLQSHRLLANKSASAGGHGREMEKLLPFSISSTSFEGHAILHNVQTNVSHGGRGGVSGTVCLWHRNGFCTTEMVGYTPSLFFKKPWLTFCFGSASVGGSRPVVCSVQYLTPTRCPPLESSVSCCRLHFVPSAA